MNRGSTDGGMTQTIILTVILSDKNPNSKTKRYGIANAMILSLQQLDV